jgi:hypothetical protein
MIPAALACAYLVGVEAGASSHCWSRELEGPDTARVLPAADVKPYDPEQVVDALASDWGDDPSSPRRTRIALNRGLRAMDSRRVRCSIEHPCAQASWSHRIVFGWLPRSGPCGIVLPELGVPDPKDNECSRLFPRHSRAIELGG